MEGKDSDAARSNGTVAGQNIPRAVKFGYREFTVTGDRWQAVCKNCNKRIQDQVHVTSAFTN